MPDSRPSVCYVVAHYGPSEHSVHLARFLEELSLRAAVHVVLWSHEGDPSFPGVASVHLLETRAGSRLLRMARLVGLAVRLRRNGCRVFFVRIAQRLALVLGLLRPILGIRVYFWHSGMATVDRPGWGGGPAGAIRQVGWLIDHWSLRAAIKVATGFVTGPESMRDYYVREYGALRRRTIVLPNDVDVDSLADHAASVDRRSVREALGLPEEASVLLYAGGVSSLRFGPNGCALTSFLERMAARRPEICMVIAGRIALPGFLSWLAASRIRDRVLLLGPVPFDELVELYVAADLFVLPVLAAGFPRVILESMALGTPFVAYDTGGTREVVGEALADVVVREGDVEGLVDRAEHILSTPSYREALRLGGLDRVRHFSVEAVVAQFYEAVVE